MSAAQRAGISQSRPILMILPPELPALISGMAIVYLPNEGLVGRLDFLESVDQHVGHIHDSNVTRAGMLQAKRVPELMAQRRRHPQVIHPVFCITVQGMVIAVAVAVTV